MICCGARGGLLLPLLCGVMALSSPSRPLVSCSLCCVMWHVMCTVAFASPSCRLVPPCAVRRGAAVFTSSFPSSVTLHLDYTDNEDGGRADEVDQHSALTGGRGSLDPDIFLNIFLKLPLVESIKWGYTLGGYLYPACSWPAACGIFSHWRAEADAP